MIQLQNKEVWKSSIWSMREITLFGSDILYSVKPTTSMHTGVKYTVIQ